MSVMHVDRGRRTAFLTGCLLLLALALPAAVAAHAELVSTSPEAGSTVDDVPGDGDGHLQRGARGGQELDRGGRPGRRDGRHRWSGTRRPDDAPGRAPSPGTGDLSGPLDGLLRRRSPRARSLRLHGRRGAKPRANRRSDRGSEPGSVGQRRPRAPPRRRAGRPHRPSPRRPRARQPTDRAVARSRWASSWSSPSPASASAWASVGGEADARHEPAAPVSGHRG